MATDASGKDSSLKKDALRQKLSHARRSMTEADYRRESSVLCHRLCEHPAVRSALDIHVFWPLAHLREPDLRPLIDAWFTAGRRVWLPIVDGQRLRAGRYAGRTSLQAGPMGTMEPAASTGFTADTPDVVIVPALAVDRAGFRLGYGGGYYDRWLADVHAETICPIFEGGFVDALPHEPHDIPVRHVIVST